MIETVQMVFLSKIDIDVSIFGKVLGNPNRVSDLKQIQELAEFWLSSTCALEKTAAAILLKIIAVMEIENINYIDFSK